VKQTPCGASHDGWRTGCTTVELEGSRKRAVKQTPCGPAMMDGRQGIRTSGNKEMGGEMDTLWGRPRWMAGRLHQN
jgi:hypothetical protein